MESVKRLVGAIFTPAETFRGIQGRPTWGLVLVVFLLLGGVSGALAIQRIDPQAQRTEVRQQLEKRGLEGEELDQGVERAAEVTERFGPVLVGVGLVGSVLGYLLIALVLWLGLRLAGGELTYLQGFSATLHGLIPAQALKPLIMIPVLLSVKSVDPQALQSGSVLQSNLAFLAPEGASRALVALLASLDVFTLWTVALLVLGMSLVGRVSKSASALVVVGAWIVWVGLKVGWFSLFG
jgi:hypothetical protein